MLTWQHGPQMVGFALMHVYPLLALAGILGYWALVGWLVVVAVVFLRRREVPTRKHFLMIVLALLVVGLGAIPYSFLAGLGGVSV